MCASLDCNLRCNFSLYREFCLSLQTEAYVHQEAFSWKKEAVKKIRTEEDQSPEFLLYCICRQLGKIRCNVTLHPSLKKQLNCLSIAKGATGMFLRPSPLGDVSDITDEAFQFSDTVNMYLNVLDETIWIPSGTSESNHLVSHCWLY